MKHKKHIFTPTFRSFSANLGEKTFDTVEVDKSPTLVTRSTSDLAKNAHAHSGMWVTFIFYLIVSYLLFAFSTCKQRLCASFRATGRGASASGTFLARTRRAARNVPTACIPVAAAFRAIRLASRQGDARSTLGHQWHTIEIIKSCSLLCGYSV
jgi:hypothetical protein